ncbi:MAG: hypothetical protein WDW36_006082 [Sanguina aurantia]
MKDLSCGVLDLLDDNSLAAAERAMAGQCGTHRGALGLGGDGGSGDGDSSGEDGSSDSGDDNAIGRDAQWSLMTRGSEQQHTGSAADGMSEGAAGAGGSAPGPAQSGKGSATGCGGTTGKLSGKHAEEQRLGGAGKDVTSGLECGPGLMAGLRKKAGKQQRRHTIEELS